MQVVSNSTPLIFLAKIGKLNLLPEIFKLVLIPKKVFEEVVVKGKEKNYSDAFIVEDFIKKNDIIIKDIEIKELRNMPLGKGEIETIELALEQKITNVLIDETKGRRIARMYHLLPKGTLWVLTRAYENELLSREELRNCVYELIKHGFTIKEDILIEVLKELM